MPVAEACEGDGDDDLDGTGDGSKSVVGLFGSFSARMLRADGSLAGVALCDGVVIRESSSCERYVLASSLKLFLISCSSRIDVALGLGGFRRPTGVIFA